MGLKIVCVDDDVSLLQILKTSLGAVLNADVTGYPGAAGSVEKVTAGGAPNILIVDYMMPGLDGLSFLGTVNAIPGWEKTCIIMLSAVASSIKTAALRNKVYAIIEKPMKPVLLAQTVADLYQKFAAGQPSPLAAAIKAKADEEVAKRLRPRGKP